LLPTTIFEQGDDIGGEGLQDVAAGPPHGICRGARGMTPVLFSTEIDMGSDLVGDTGIEPVTSSV
jgi:hypothetical protein